MINDDEMIISQEADVNDMNKAMDIDQIWWLQGGKDYTTKALNVGLHTKFHAELLLLVVTACWWRVHKKFRRIPSPPHHLSVGTACSN